jgi:hypothetical protein
VDKEYWKNKALDHTQSWFSVWLTYIEAFDRMRAGNPVCIAVYTTNGRVINVQDIYPCRTNDQIWKLLDENYPFASGVLDTGYVFLFRKKK